MKQCEMVTVSENAAFEELFAIYEREGWTQYCKDKAQLRESIDKSLKLICIRKNSELVGFVRLLGDGINTVVIQDVIVKKEERRNGYGTKLIDSILYEYKDVRQIVLICDKKDELMAFYSKSGLRRIEEYECVCFGKL